MAESNDSWWGSWYNTAKSKSAEVFDAVRKDLGEISSVVKGEASAASSAISQTLKLDEPDSTASQVKKSFSAFLGQVGTVLNPAPDDDDVEAILITSGHGTVPLTGLQKHLLELQLKDSTYLTPPEPALKTQYERWEDVILEDQLTQDRLARHLASSTVLNEKYVTFVPDKVGHHDFWMRYLFRKALLEDGLAQAEAAERKAKLAESASVTSVAPPVVEPTMVQPRASGGTLTHSKSNNEISNKASNLSLHDELSQSQSIQSSESTPSFSSLGFTSDLNEEAVRWELEDFSCDVELSEEQQSLLLQEYEKEMKERVTTKDTNKDTSKSDLIVCDKKTNNSTKSIKSPTTNVSTGAKSPKKSTTIANKQSKQNLKVTKSSASNNTKNKTQQNKSSNKAQVNKSPADKSDAALPIETDHFKQDNQSEELKTKQSKDSVDNSKSSDNRSNNSDESWEKEFEDLED